MNYHNRRFRPVNVSSNGLVSGDLIFHYQQEENIVSCLYQSKDIIKGQLIGLVDVEGHIDMRYQQISCEGVLMTGVCISRPELLPDGKIRLHEEWQWTSGDHSKGTSILQEL